MEETERDQTSTFEWWKRQLVLPPAADAPEAAATCSESADVAVSSQTPQWVSWLTAAPLLAGKKKGGEH